MPTIYVIAGPHGVGKTIFASLNSQPGTLNLEPAAGGSAAAENMRICGDPFREKHWERLHCTFPHGLLFVG